MGLWISLVISVRIRIRYRSILYLFMNHKHISVTVVIYIPFFFGGLENHPTIIGGVDLSWMGLQVLVIG